MYFNEPSDHQYQTFIDILAEMVSRYAESQSKKGESIGGGSNQTEQPTESSSRID
ncbi:MAG TPA: hypothetical protein VK105_00145 [Virgibacillus sp.]|nr:hypothetical protein [Virgibacillus sp.]HLR65533.1 hypothetical protein [Virgibacillus sp.]